MEGSMLTLSLANWMELPGLKLKEWLREKRRSVSQYLSVSPPVHLSVCVSFFSFFKFILKCFTDRGYLINLCQSTQQMISNGFSALSLLVRYGVLGSCWGVLGGFYSVLGDTSQVWGKNTPWSRREASSHPWKKIREARPLLQDIKRRATLVNPYNLSLCIQCQQLFADQSRFLNKLCEHLIPLLAKSCLKRW